MPRNIDDSVQGMLDILILKTLSLRAMYGYALAQWIFETSGQQLQILEGTLYPALHRLESRGWARSEWGRSDTHRAIKIYHLTPQGRQELDERLRRWEHFARAVDRVLTATSKVAAPPERD